MSYYSRNCSTCNAPIYVTFKKLDGRESTATKIARGAVQFEFHLKKATHSGEHLKVRKTFCIHCGPAGMVECWVEIRAQLLDPNGIDPPRKTGPSFKARRRQALLEQLDLAAREEPATVVTHSNPGGAS